MDKITKGLLTAFADSEGLSTLDESAQFERFCNFAVISSLVPETLNVDDVSVGAGADTGIDGIAIIVNGALVTDENEVDQLVATTRYLDADFLFVQAKTSSSFSGAELSSFAFGVRDFFSDEPRLARNEFIGQAAAVQRHIYTAHSAKMTNRRPRVFMYYVTTGKWVGDNDLSARIQSAKEDLSALAIFESIAFTPLGAREIQDAYQQTQRKVSAEILFAQKVVLDVPGVSEAYLGILPASEFLKLVVDSAGVVQKSVFYDNVRDFQDFNQVNSEIRSTLRSDDRGRFVLMNNGITIIAKAIQQIGNRFIVKDYQVVNGCQTSHVIAESAAHVNSSVQVPVKLIVAEDEAIANSIVKATNRQTQVKPQQLYALSDFQKQLEAYYAATAGAGKLYYERRSRQYAGETGVEKVRIIPIQQQLRVFAAMFLDQAHKGHYARSLDAQVGEDIFVERHRLEPYYAASFAFYKLEFFFRNGSIDVAHKPLRYAILMAARHLYNPDMPSLAANAMRGYAEGLVQVMLDDDAARKLFSSAVDLLLEVVGVREANRDLTKTQVFTAEVLARLQR